MPSFLTTVIEYADYNEIVKLLDELHNCKIRFWFMHKQGKIRLRTLDIDVKQVEKKVSQCNLIATQTLYEAETYLFGGEKSIVYVHELLCDIGGIASRIKSLAKGCSQSGFDKCLCLHFVNQMIGYCQFDDFEEWDVWNKVCEQRRIDVKEYGEIILSKLYDVQQSVSCEQFNLEVIDNEQTAFYFSDIKRQCRKIVALAYCAKMTRGVRSIFSTVIIFAFNMMSISAQQQCGFAHIMRALTNPDFRREIGW